MAVSSHEIWALGVSDPDPGQRCDVMNGADDFLHVNSILSCWDLRVSRINGLLCRRSEEKRKLMTKRFATPPTAISTDLHRLHNRHFRESHWWILVQRYVWSCFLLTFHGRRFLTGLIPLAAYLGALLSYSIVVYKSLGVPSLSNLTPYMQRALMDDNVQYALLAMYWAISKPVYSTFQSRDVRKETNTDRMIRVIGNSLTNPVRYLLAIPRPYFPKDEHHTQVFPSEVGQPVDGIYTLIRPANIHTHIIALHSTGPPPTPGQARPPPAGLEGLNRKIQVWVKS